MMEKPRLRHYFEYLTLRLFDGVLLALPFRASLGLAKMVALFAYYVVPIRRRIVRENLRRALGDLPASHLRRLGRRCYVNAALTFCEFARMRTMNRHEILGLIESVEGEEYFIEVDAARSATVPHAGSASGTHPDKQGGAGKPYLAITGHLGNWELMGAYFAIKGVPITVIAKPIHNPLVDRYVNSIRAAKGYDVISTREGMKRVVSRLREGRVIVFLADQDARKSGIFVNFFGYPASTHTGPALFMTRMNLPLLPVFDVRTTVCASSRQGSPVRHKIIFREPIYPPEEALSAGEQSRHAAGCQAGRDEAIRRVTEQHVHLLEEMVRAYPDQYFWFHQRWKTKPRQKAGLE
jgi:KDO2-lipid IV(A) lauroyltransferase